MNYRKLETRTVIYAKGQIAEVYHQRRAPRSWMPKVWQYLRTAFSGTTNVSVQIDPSQRVSAAVTTPWNFPCRVYTAIPEHRQARAGDRGSKLKPGDAVLWGGKIPVPYIGQRVRMDFQPLGNGEVVGYFTQGGYLGVRIKPDAAPKYYVKQNGADALYYAFGAEIELI